MVTLSILLVVGAFVCTVLEAIGKCPSWVPTMLLVMLMALMVIPK